MKSRRFIAKNMCNFYEEVSEKMKNKLIRLQTDQEFNQNKIKKLNKKHNVRMFLANVCAGKDKNKR